MIYFHDCFIPYCPSTNCVCISLLTAVHWLYCTSAWSYDSICCFTITEYLSFHFSIHVWTCERKRFAVSALRVSTWICLIKVCAIFLSWLTKWCVIIYFLARDWFRFKVNGLEKMKMMHVTHIYPYVSSHISFLIRKYWYSRSENKLSVFFFFFFFK